MLKSLILMDFRIIYSLCVGHIGVTTFVLDI